MLFFKKILNPFSRRAKTVFLSLGGWRLIVKLLLGFPVIREKIRRYLFEVEVIETKDMNMSEDAKVILRELTSE